MQFMAEPTSPPEVATLGRCSGCVTACFMTQQGAMAALGELAAFHLIPKACSICPSFVQKRVSAFLSFLSFRVSFPFKKCYFIILKGNM